MKRILLAALLSPVLLLSGPASAGAELRFGPLHLHDPSVGLALGYGSGTKAAGSGLVDGHRVELLGVYPQLQFALFDPFGPRFFRSRIDMRWELVWLTNFEPQYGYAVGLAGFLRWHVLSLDPVVPYIQAGAGPIHLDFDLFDQADGQAFVPQGGAGLAFRLGPHLALTTEARFHHISNAFTQARNNGIDNWQFVVGLSWGLGAGTILEHRP